MAHLWTQFRDLIAGPTVLKVDAVLDLLGEAKIYRTRSRPRQVLPAVSVFTTNERVVQIENNSRTNTSDKRYWRQLDVAVEVIVAEEVDGDTALDAICLEVEKQMAASDTMGGVVLGTDLVSTQFTVDGTGETTLHVARMLYRIEYRMESLDPETAIN